MRCTKMLKSFCQNLISRVISQPIRTFQHLIFDLVLAAIEVEMCWTKMLKSFGQNLNSLVISQSICTF